MKSKLNIIVLFVLIGTTLFGQKQIDTPYDFPVKPGMSEWAIFETGEEMLEACQIPGAILSQMSTKALVETCLNYPLKYDYSAFNDTREGISALISSFNGLKELAERESCGKVLIEAYEKTPVIKYQSFVKEHDYPILQLEYLELLLSDDLFLNGMSTDDYVTLKNLLAVKYEEKLENLTVYSVSDIQNSLLLGSKILKTTKYKKLSDTKLNEIDRYIKEFSNSDAQLMESVSKILFE